MLDTHTLIWLFPIAFMFHDFEEILLFEPWLKKNAGDIEARLKPIVPASVGKRIGAILGKSTAEFAFPVSLIFALTVVAAWLAVVNNAYSLFLLASGAFFLHGFMHLGQALILRRYIPAVITSVLIVIPYGLVVYARLIGDGLIDLPGLLVNWLLSVVLIVPVILVMHIVGDYVYRQAQRLLG